jgi:hypothetical protein
MDGDMASVKSDSWQRGVDGWWTSMDSSRRWLEDLGRQVESTADGAVHAEDMSPLLDAIPTLRRVEHHRRFLREGPLRPPEGDVRWTVPGRVVFRRPGLDLRDFSAPDAPPAVPMLIVAPEVNGAHIADFGEGQSLVRAG